MRDASFSCKNHIVKQGIVVFLCSNRVAEFPLDITRNTETITSSFFRYKLPGIWKVIEIFLTKFSGSLVNDIFSFSNGDRRTQGFDWVCFYSVIDLQLSEYLTFNL